MDDPKNVATPPSNQFSGSAKPDRPAAPKENIKETIESILVAFILAFVFRAFVVEAFVIPSGSMAPTLLGGHMRYRCEECGYDFDVNYPTDTSREDLSIPSVSGPVAVPRDVRGPDGGYYRTTEPKNAEFSVHCPNCGLKVRRDNPDPRQSAVNTPVYYGDRILVLKYIYQLEEPKRWDVVVFKSPTEARHDFTQNFIKRLVGNPGEVIMLLDGDVYVSPNKGNVDTPIDGWIWRVQTKPKVVQDSLWRVIYNNDFLPQNSPRRTRSMAAWRQPWQQRNGQGWNTGPIENSSRIFRFNNPQGSGALSFDKDANPGTFPFSDWLPYDETKPFQHVAQTVYDFEAYGDNHVFRWNVSDLKMQFTYQRKTGGGPLRAVLTRLDDQFTAEFLPNLVRLHRRVGDAKSIVMGEAALPPDNGRALSVEFTNVDYQVTVRVDGKDLLQTHSQSYYPNVRKLLQLHRQRAKLISENADKEQIRNVFPPPRVELIAADQECEIAHLSLWRDVYYTPSFYDDRYFTDLQYGSPERPVKLASAEDGKENEYFVLGDNSILSGDARIWRAAVDLRQSDNLYADAGRVPERFMLGKAFFVYWPAGFRPLSVNMPGVVPNFGDMRFIH